MDGLRRHVREAQFRVGTRSLADPVMATHHGEDYSRFAETAISTMYDAALADIERQYGRIEGGDMAVVGLGKLGSGEMTLQSDLDLILICDCPDFAALSDGAKPLDADRWFARAARRLMNGLSARHRKVIYLKSIQDCAPQAMPARWSPSSAVLSIIKPIKHGIGSIALTRGRFCRRRCLARESGGR